MEVLPQITLHRPATLIEAIELSRGPKATSYISGGTDLIANLRRGLTPNNHLIDLSGVNELKGITSSNGGISIGGATTLAEITTNNDISRNFPALSMAAQAVAGPTHREVATIGGNLCLDTRCYFYNQSQWWRDSNDGCMKYQGEICHVVPTSKRCYAAYSGDIAPALLVLGAEVNISGPKGTRRLPLAELFNDDGIDYLTLNDGEMVSSVHLPATMSTPPSSGAASSYAKLRIRASIDFPLAGVALRIALTNGKLTAINAAITGTKSIPVAITGLEVFTEKPFDRTVAGDFSKLIQKQISPLHTTTTQPQYRRRAIASMARTMALDLIGALNN